MKRIVVLAALSAIVSHSLSRSTYPILLPAIENDLLGGSHAKSGTLGTILFVAYMAGVAGVTTFSGRVEPALLLKGGLISSAIGLGTLGIANDFTSLSAGIVLTGFGSAGIWMSAPALATGAVPPHRRGTVMGLLSSTMGFGILLISQGTTIVRQITDDDGAWRPTWLAGMAYSTIVLVAVTVLLRTEATERVAGGISFAQLKGVPGWIALSAGYSTFGIIVSVYTPFLGAKLEEDGFSRPHVSAIYSLMGVAAIPGAIGIGRLSDRIGRRPVLIGTMAGMCGASLLVLSGREPFASVSAAAFGACSFAFPVMVAAVVRDHTSDRAFSKALGAMTLIYGVGLIVGPIAAGYIADSRFGFDLVYQLVTAATLLAVWFVWQLPTEGRLSRVAAVQPLTGGGDGQKPTDEQLAT